MLVIGAIALGVLAVLGLVALNERMLPSDLVDADFDRTAEPFITGEIEYGAFDLVDGAYRLTVRQEPDGPLGSFGWFPRLVYSVEVAVDVVAADALERETIVGVGCVEEGLGDVPGGSQFIFVAGGGWSAIGHRDMTSPEDTFQQNTVAERNSGIRPGDRISLVCSVDLVSGLDPLHADTVHLTASVNGEVVLEGSHDLGDSTVGFGGMVLVFLPSAIRQQASFDNAAAHVPD